MANNETGADFFSFFFVYIFWLFMLFLDLSTFNGEHIVWSTCKKENAQIQFRHFLSCLHP